MTVENPPAGQGSVVLDIGGDIGALVVTMPPELEGVEVEINRIDLANRAITAAQNHDHLHSHDHHHLYDPAKNMITTESMIMSIHMIMRRTVHT
jgi:hypothetical protein